MKTTIPSAPPKKRGPAPSGRARTGAQRSAALRERAKTLVFEGGPLSEVTDTCLLEAFGLAYRAHMAFEVERIAGELVRRAAQHKNPVVGPKIEPAVVAEEADKAVVVTDKQAPAPSAYQQEVRDLALAMAASGEPLSAIRAAVVEASGQPPDAKTWAMVMGIRRKVAKT